MRVSQRIRKRIEEAVRMDQDGRRTGEDEVARSRSRRMRLHLQRPRLQYRAASEAADMTAPAGCQQIGPWRIIEADQWDRGYLDLGGPATITIGADNHGEIALAPCKPA